MTRGSFRNHVREDNIHVFEIDDISLATVRAWKMEVMGILDTCDRPVKHFYDFRRITTLSRDALRAGIEVRSHPNMVYVYVAILTNKSRVIELANLVIKMQTGGQFQIFASEAEAVAWLNRWVP